MSTAFGNKMRAAAVKVIDKFGIDMILTADGFGGFDVTTGRAIRLTTDTQQTAKCAPFGRISTQRAQTDDNVQISDAVTWVKQTGLTVPIAIGMTVQISPSGRKMRCVAVDKFDADELPAAYRLILRDM